MIQHSAIFEPKVMLLAALIELENKLPQNYLEQKKLQLF